ncbi:MAG: alpha-glucan family phosphorylase, partial [Candidatus Pacearchaeota archaeon]
VVFVKCWLYKLKTKNNFVIPVIFLDSDLEENKEYYREITKKLYGGDEDYRLCQEIILGIGGLRMLRELGCNIEKYHMNEGHSSLLTLEVYNELKDLEKTREKCVFTTHTPVPAGHDQFDRKKAEEFLKEYLNNELKEKIFYQDKLNMTYLGLFFSKHINGVAKKHAEVSKGMFPGYHIESITNGVHSVFWTAEPFKKIYDKYIPNWREDPFNLRYIAGIPEEKLWEAHKKAKKKLLSFIKKKKGIKMSVEKFTIGFARRATGYKRADLLLTDTKRLLKIAKKFEGIQIIYSGKAHPRDIEGKELIKRIFKKIKEIQDKEGIKIVYLENYDLDIAKLMTSGVDLWLNNPLKPKEASGTSGMKAAHNGIPQFSVLDGWWVEGHIENVTGWSIGSNSKENNPEEEIEDLYSKLEYIILPTYYKQRDRWIKIMKNTIAYNASFFNSHRMLQQYVLTTYFE